METIVFNNSVEMIDYIIKRNQCTALVMMGSAFYDDAIAYFANIVSPAAPPASHIQLYGIDEIIYESTVGLTESNLQWGVVSHNIWDPKADVTNWKSNKAYYLCFFPEITKKQWQAITNQARISVGQKVSYNFSGLFGVARTAIMYAEETDPVKKAQILKDNNPFDTYNSMFCSQAFCDWVKKGSGIDLLPDFAPDETPPGAILLTEATPIEAYQILPK